MEPSLKQNTDIQASAALEVLLRYWGHRAFRPLQEEIITSVLSGQDTLALLPTGGGKSVCYQVPALMREGMCIVISPLIALMKDQVANLHKKGIRAVAVYAGMSRREIDQALNNCMYGAYKFLYLSPERLATDIVRMRLERMPVTLLAVDEAHCISQWGYDFRPPYLRIAEIRPLLKDVPVLALTATATRQVREDICAKLAFRDYKVFQASFERKNIAYVVRYEENKLQKIQHILHKVRGSAIVYARNRKKTREIASFLSRQGIAADYYHAGLPMHLRNAKQEKWIAGEIRVMVCTNAFGMGIDKPDVRCVIHVDLPENIEMYYQESGRAGRDGKKSYAVLLYNLADRTAVEKRMTSLFPSEEEVRRVYSAVCSYLQVAEGAGKGESYDFDILDFCKRFRLDVLKTHHALHLLEQSGHLSLSDAVSIPSRIRIIVGREELYKFQVSNAAADPIVKLLLRTHIGVFDEMVYTYEAEIASRLHISKEEVVRTLTLLDQLKLAAYERSKDKPQLTFLEARVDARYLPLDGRFIRKRKKHYEEQLRAMLQYALNNTRCRSQYVLDYFGETDNQRCGICDICLERNKLGLTDLELEDITAAVKDILLSQPCTMDELVGRVRYYAGEKVIYAVRWLLDKGQVGHENNQLIWQG
ncbi:MAG: ATP-dependent DNA helicase RecQ [Chitinophagales bacterium]|nr:MAG: ATP-dependent DNA helicase RecQ [Chitinophagales bacterium]